MLPRLDNNIFASLITILFYAGLSPALWAADNNVEQEFHLIYSGNLNGEYEPCGCAKESDLGGMMRRGTMIKQLRQAMPELLLISAGGLISSQSPQDKIKAGYILKSYSMLAYDAIGLQWPDLAFGPAFLESTPLPWVSSNHYQHVPTQRVIMRKKQRFVFFSWIDPVQAPDMMHSDKQNMTKPETAALREALREAKQQTSITLLSTTLSLADAQKQLPLGDVDILILKAVDEQIGAPNMIGNMLVLRPGTRGMRLGQLSVHIKDQRIEKYQHKIIQLPRSIEDDPLLTQQHQAYNDAVRADYMKRVAIRKKHQSGESPFTGDEACESCHKQAYMIWQNSKHAHAYETLEKVGKAYDPECIGCHSVGFDQSGGFVDPMITSNLMHVQCENCHGPGQAHVKSKGEQKTLNANLAPIIVCKQCHVGSHSPVFKLKEYWQKVKH